MPDKFTRTCPACGAPGPKATAFTVRQPGHGVADWCVCPDCRAYLALWDFDEQQLVQETRTMAWGQAEAGIQLNFFKSRMFVAILKRLERLKPAPAHLLDIGCSFGGFLFKARTAGYAVAGTDIVPEAVNYLGTQGIEAQVVSSVRDYRNPPAHGFDIVTSFDCSYYWPNQRAEFTHIFNHLKPGGILVVRAVTKAWMIRFALLIRSLNRKMSDRILIEAVNDHVSSVSAKGIVRVLKEVGFELVDATPRGAVHSNETRFIVKVMFALGTVLHGLTGILLSPGVVIIVRKPAPTRA